MNLTIHRGTKEIGGSCVELKTQKSRILIDFGIPLVSSKNDLPDVQGLYKNQTKGIDAILISHSHLDHYGLLKYVHPDIPIYMSEGAKELIRVSDMFISHEVGELNITTFSKMKRERIKDFEVTPYLVDHSAFDALAFLIESDGKRVFYSGDFRSHGRKSSLFTLMINKPVKNVECLLLEGTMIGRGEQAHGNEQDVERRITEILKAHKRINFISLSSQNIDRLVSAYRACLRSDSIFVIDVYTAFILEKLAKISKGIPQYDWKNIRIKFFTNHINSLKKAGYGDLLERYAKKAIDITEIKLNLDKILMLARDNSIFPRLINKIGDVRGSRIIYSLWEGYLTDKFKEYCAQKGLIIEQVHTSGHAVVADLKAFARALDPKVLIPMHTFQPEDYPKLFKNVKVLKDGESLQL